MDDYKIKSRIWIETAGYALIGEGKVRLLKAIDKEGSLFKAAKSIDMSYSKAWTLLDGINKFAKKAVVKKTVGGQQGGGTVITPYGKKLIIAFETINKNCWAFLDQQIKAIEDI